MNKAKQSGFTIVELLVVIVIIGILATIGFVTFANAQNQAKQSEVESTMAQAKSKLGEYYATFNTYPADETALVAYLNGTNNSTVATKMGDLGGTDVIAYAATQGDGSTACTVTATDADSDGVPETASGDCETFTLTGTASYWGGSTNLVVTP